MRTPLTSRALALAAIASTASAATASLKDVCTVEYAKSKLPASDFIQGITLDPSSVTTNIVYNASTSATGTFFPAATFSYCNFTLAYSHDGREGDQVLVQYWLPDPAKFENRYLSTGGGGYAINSGSQSLPGGVMYGAVAGATDGGFGSFSTNADAAMLLANGTLDYETLYMFGYKAHWELSKIGKQFTRNFFSMGENTKLYSYYQGCSEGGREGWSQIQRFGDEWDGAAIGAPAFRWSFQQTQHLYSNVVTQTLGYYPPPCEMEKIINETISACDSLDGLKDGVVSRSDLCQLHFDLSTVVGKPYYCAAAAASSGYGGSSAATPVQNGTVSKEAVEVAKEVIRGLRDSQGRQVYLSYQTAATFADVTTQYNTTAKKWELEVDGLGAEFIALLLDKNGTDLSNLNGVTYDTLKEWMISGMQEYASTLQTNWPDLTPFHKAGGKVIHFHGEADNSIPTASSVRYWESVRSIMYPSLSYKDGANALKDWYQLYLVPGAAHCATNSLMPNGPFPQTNLQVLINWVEKDVKPVTLNATVLQGEYVGENRQICAWPLRPIWKNGKMSCEYDQTSIDTWHYDFDGVPLPVY
ncbi:Tannase [Penicillium subrubescens]|uniref:Carboxylic ester hydrolase n=1 Tax=Penicillium subrubescens TaxID=1316194 RepID=A0A1Q5ULM0_9EURO|nr:Tannase [Penicillium subrubescens]KAJ5886968.1 Tannase [Penicillium subrubescens]OKP13388.1 Tannase [Penicillium subrubescens]